MSGISVANNLLANQIQLNLDTNQSKLSKLTSELSTGLRVNGPQDDPAGYGISTNLNTDIQGLNQSVQNIQNAQNAASVASGALSSVTSILQQIRTLAVQASSNLLSSNDLKNVQSEIGELVGEVNSISQDTQFNGVNLLNGSFSGFVAATNASATITQNSTLNSSSNNLIGSVTYTASDTTVADGTFEFQVVQSNGTIATEVFYISSGTTGASGVGLNGTLLTTIDGPIAVSYAYNDVTITINAVATADVGSTAAIKILQYVSAGAATVPSITVQTGAAVGDTVSFGLGNASASALRIGGLNVQASQTQYNALAASDTIGQVDEALAKVLSIQQSIGSASIRLGLESDNDSLASVNLQSSESSIRDLNVAQASSQYTSTQLLINFGTTLLAQANTNAQSVLALFR